MIDELELERLTLEVWAPEERVELDGWELCWSGGYTRRTNSVQPLGDGTLDVDLDLDDRIAACEAHYRARGGRAVFKLTDASRPVGLDAQLERRGWIRADPTSVQVADLGPEVGEREPGVDIDTRLSEPWFDACATLNGVGARDRAALRGILERAPGVRAHASIPFDGSVAALGFGVLHREHLYLCEVVTAGAFRRRGLSRRLVASMLAWARERGARRAFLQAVAANEPALALYAGLGFREAYRYWYRSRDRARS